MPPMPSTMQPGQPVQQPGQPGKGGVAGNMANMGMYMPYSIDPRMYMGYQQQYMQQKKG